MNDTLPVTGAYLTALFRVFALYSIQRRIKEETVVWDTIDKVIEIRRCCGMEMDLDKTKVIRISRQPFPVKITIDQKQLENVEFLNICVAF